MKRVLPSHHCQILPYSTPTHLPPTFSNTACLADTRSFSVNSSSYHASLHQASHLMCVFCALRNLWLVKHLGSDFDVSPDDVFNPSQGPLLCTESLFRRNAFRLRLYVTQTTYINSFTLPCHHLFKYIRSVRRDGFGPLHCSCSSCQPLHLRPPHPLRNPPLPFNRNRQWHHNLSYNRNTDRVLRVTTSS